MKSEFQEKNGGMNMFSLKDIKVGMNYIEIQNQIRNTDNLIITCLPSFCGSDYDVAENLDTKEKVYVLRNYNTNTIIDITEDYDRAVNCNRANRNITEILHNNGC